MVKVSLVYFVYVHILDLLMHKYHKRDLEKKVSK